MMESIVIVLDVEIKNMLFNKDEIYYKTKTYESSEGKECYISANIKNKCNNPYKSTLVDF